MTESKTYKSAHEFRQALEEHIAAGGLSGEELAAYTAELAYERLLARLDPARWMLKGGCAVNLLSAQCRPTQDLDLALREESLLQINVNDRSAAILAAVREELAKDAGDFFEFEARTAVPIGDFAPTALAAMVLVRANVAGEKLCDIRVDVAVEGREILEPERVRGKDLLEFARIESPEITVAAKELIFAEKLVAYSEQGDTGVRVRDLVDMPLLADLGLDTTKLATAIKEVCDEQSRAMPKLPTSPPATWEKEFDKLAESCQLSLTLKDAHDQVVSIAQLAIDMAKKRELID